VSHAYHNSIVSKNPWLNKNSWFPEVMGGPWNPSNYMYVINFGAHYDARKPNREIDDRFRAHAQQRRNWVGCRCGRPHEVACGDAESPILPEKCPRITLVSFDVLLPEALLRRRSPDPLIAEWQEPSLLPLCSFLHGRDECQLLE